jgi:hypothetical protein
MQTSQYAPHFCGLAEIERASHLAAKAPAVFNFLFNLSAK